MNKKIFNQLQKEGLIELRRKRILKTKSWWDEGPRYTLQLWKGSLKNRTRVYMHSIKSIKIIPNSVYHEGVKYVLDYKEIKDTDFPLHFIPYVGGT